MGTLSLGLYLTYTQALRSCVLTLGESLPSLLALMGHIYRKCTSLPQTIQSGENGI